MPQAYLDYRSVTLQRLRDTEDYSLHDMDFALDTAVLVHINLGNRSVFIECEHNHAHCWWRQ